MIKPIKLIIIIIFYFFLLKNASYSRTSITLELPSSIPSGMLSEEDIGTADMEIQIQDTTDINGPYVTDGFALANVLGYPIGKAYLGSFPHFEMGISMGAGCANMKYFDENDPASSNGTLPVIAPNPVAHFGIGLFGGVDVLGKVFYVSKSAIKKYKEDVDYETEYATLSDFKIYSVGGKLRFNLFKRKRLFPFYMAFGGVTVSLGGDFMYGDIAVEGDYEYDFEDISMDIPAPFGTQAIDMHFDGSYDLNIHWAIFSLGVQAITYFDLFYFFSLYTGFGVAGNIGSFSLEFNGTGQVVTTNEYYKAVFGTVQIGSLSFVTMNSYKAYPIMPTYILGLEINIFIIKLNFETMVSMINRSDVNAQVGARFQL